MKKKDISILTDLIIYDNDNKLYDIKLFVKEKNEISISKNVFKMIQDKRDIQISSYDITEKEIKPNYTRSEGLYDRLIEEYNENHPDGILQC